MGKSTISMAIFNRKLLNYQRVNHVFESEKPRDSPVSEFMGYTEFPWFLASIFHQKNIPQKNI